MVCIHYQNTKIYIYILILKDNKGKCAVKTKGKNKTFLLQVKLNCPHNFFFLMAGNISNVLAMNFFQNVFNNICKTIIWNI